MSTFEISLKRKTPSLLQKMFISELIINGLKREKKN